MQSEYIPEDIYLRSQEEKMHALVGSKNPVKIEAVRDAFAMYFANCQIEEVEVESGVPGQPINEQTFQGAENRVKRLREKGTSADFYVGVEGGIIQTCGRWFSCGVVCIGDKTGRQSFGTSPHFPLPESMLEQMLGGIELGTIMAELTGDPKIKQKGGAIGYLTREVIKRKDLYIAGTIVALIPFLNEELYRIKK